MCRYTMTTLFTIPTTLITIPKLATTTRFVSNWSAPARFRPFLSDAGAAFDVRWVDQWLAGGGYRPYRNVDGPDGKRVIVPDPGGLQ
jgi:hypothetical protein